MPDTTNNLKDLLTAFSAAQAEIGNVKTDLTNPAFKSKYASLEAVQDAAFPALRAHGLVAIQGAYSVLDEQGQIQVTGTLSLHHIESGQHIDAQLTMIPKDNSPQAIGSCVTYLRRYLLLTTLGLGTADDDGEAATNHKAGSQASATRTHPKADAPTEQPQRMVTASSKQQVVAAVWQTWQSPPQAVKWALQNELYSTEADATEALRAVLAEVYHDRTSCKPNEMPAVFQKFFEAQVAKVAKASA